MDSAEKVVNIGFWGLGLVSVQKTGEPILTIYKSYDNFLYKELPLGVTMIAAALKFFSDIVFF